MKHLLLVSGLFMLLLVSCKKDVSNSTQGNYSGNYKFVSMEADTKSINQTSSGSEVDKTVTISHYTTKNNSGTVLITPTTIPVPQVAHGTWLLTGALAPCQRQMIT